MVAVLGVAVAAYLWLSREVERVAHPLEAISSDAPVIMEFRSLAEAVSPLAELAYRSDLLASEAFGAPWARMVLLDSLFRSSAMLSSVSGFHALRPDASGLITVMKALGEVTSEDLRLELATLSGMSVSGTDESPVFSHSSGLQFTVRNALLIVASETAWLDEAVALIGSGASAFSDRLLEQTRASAGKNVQMNVYMRRPFQWFPGGSVWSETGDLLSVDVTTRAEGFVMNGFAHLPDSTSQLLSVFRQQQPSPMQFQGGVPADVSSLLMFGASDLPALHASIMELSNGRAAIESLNEDLGVQVTSHFFPWMAGQFGVCRLPMRGGLTEDFVVMMVSSQELADRLLHALAKVAGADSAAVRAMPVNGLLRKLFGPQMPEFPMHFFARHQDFVVFGASAEAVGMYLHQLKADRTLATDLAFGAFSEQFSSSFNVFSYQFLPEEAERFNERLSPSAIQAWGSAKGLVSTFPMFGVQFSSAGGAFYTNMHWRYAPDWRKGPLREAVASMEAPLLGRPWFVRNHVSGEVEILAQDAKNTLYLFNRNGQELFRRALTESIQGEVMQVDRSRNGELEYVFGTNNFIFQIDRNGKDMAGFPLELQSPVAVPVTVVDYGKREYRVIAACKNNRIYNFGADGKEVKGWKFDRMTSAPATSVVHVTMEGKDYLVIADVKGKVHLLDRTGASRVAVKETVSLSKNSVFRPFVSKKKGVSGFYATDEDGTVVHVQPTGSVQLISLGKFTADHHFLAVDLDSDGEPEFAFRDLNMLKVFNRSKKLLFEMRLAPDAIGPFEVESAGQGGPFIGLALPEANEILLLDGGGDVKDGFPLAGRSRFDMTALPEGERLVVTGSANGLMIHTLE